MIEGAQPKAGRAWYNSMRQWEAIGYDTWEDHHKFADYFKQLNHKLYIGSFHSCKGERTDEFSEERMAQKQFHQLVMDSMTAKGIDVFSLDNIYHSMYLEEDGTTPADFTTSNMRLYQFLTEAIYVELFFDTIKFSRTKSYQIDKHDNHYNKDATIHANSKGKLEFCKMLRTPLPKDVQARKDRCQQREEEYEGRAVNVARHTYHAHQQRRAYSLYQMYHIIVNTKRQSSDGRQSLLYEMSTYTQLACVSAGKYNAPIYRTNIHPISHHISEWCGELDRELMANQSIQQFITVNKDINGERNSFLKTFNLQFTTTFLTQPHSALTATTRMGTTFQLASFMNSNQLSLHASQRKDIEEQAFTLQPKSSIHMANSKV